MQFLCRGPAFLVKTVKRNKLFYAYQLQTRKLPCLQFYYALFYKDKIKYISPELIYFINAEALAH